MAKDDRLYARFDIGMDEHPKILLLSDAAFRALHEATYYARRQLTDGFLAEGVVLKKWGRDVVPELTTNHPERPSWVRVEGGWQIHDFAEHQTTNADIQTKRASGRLGGLAKAKGAASTPVAPATETLEQKASTTLAKTETETKTKTKTSTTDVVERPAKRGSRLSPEWMPSAASIAKAQEDAPQVDHKAEHATFVDYWIAQPGQKGVKTDWEATWRNWMRRKQGDMKSRPARQTPEQRARQTMALATDIDMRGIEA